MPSYRDTLTLDPPEVIGNLTSDPMEELISFIRDVGFIHGEKSSDSVEFELEADDLWDLHETVLELTSSILHLVSYTPDKQCITP